MSVNVDAANWRLRTSGGIPYKFMEMTGTFAEESANAQWKSIIRASDLIPLMAEIFPPPLTVGNVTIPRTASMPGAPGLRAKKASFATQTPGRPIDPFGADVGAPSNTYEGFVTVTVDFGTGFKQEEPDTDDPTTFLEISANASGEFIHSTCPKAKWQKQKNSALGSSTTQPADDSRVADNDTGEKKGNEEDDGEPEINRVPDVPHIITAPQTEWSLRWPQVDYDLFVNVIIHRLRLLLGKVNSKRADFLFKAAPETLLFTGFSYTTQYTWRDDTVEKAPVNLTMNFLEKHVYWKGVTCGHNHFWRPGHGWQLLLIDGENKTYASWDMNLLFKK